MGDGELGPSSPLASKQKIRLSTEKRFKTRKKRVQFVAEGEFEGEEHHIITRSCADTLAGEKKERGEGIIREPGNKSLLKRGGSQAKAALTSR